MDLALTFGKGVIIGEGNDNIGAFVVRGRYDANTKECHWTKSYVGQHDVFYRGFREAKYIWGNWDIREISGGFKIWPLAGEGDPEVETEEQEQPVDGLGELVEVG